MQCQARSKRTGQQCRENAVDGFRVCYYHGGGQNVGLANPSFKYGRYSTHLPKRMLQTYETALRDPEILEFKADIALVDARVDELLKRVDSGESGASWSAVAKALDEFNAVKIVGSEQEMVAKFQVLETAIAKGRGDYAAWGEIMTLLEVRRKLSEAERKRLIEMRNVISAEQATVMIYRIMDVLRRNIHDKRVLLAIGREIQSMVAQGAVDVNEMPPEAVAGEWELDGEQIDLKVTENSPITHPDNEFGEGSQETAPEPGANLENNV